MTNRFAPLRDEFQNLSANIREQVNKVLEDTFLMGSSLPLDIYETSDSVIIMTGALLGLKLDSLDISVTEGHEITLEGETVAPEMTTEGQFIRRERKFGHFSRTVSIPTAVAAEEAKASYKDNVLTITLPKMQQSGPKVVKVTPV